MISISRLKHADARGVKDINILVHQLSKHTKGCSLLSLRRIVKNSLSELWVARDNKRIVGMGVLYLVEVPERLKARIEDLVVLAEYRGQRIGQRIMNILIKRAWQRKVSLIELTSRPARTAANKLYLKVKFERTPTNTYRLYAKRS